MAGLGPGLGLGAGLAAGVGEKRKESSGGSVGEDRSGDGTEAKKVKV